MNKAFINNINCSNIKNNEILATASNKVLRNKHLSKYIEEIIEIGGAKQVTLNQMQRLLKALKKDGYTLDQIIKLIEYITDTKDKYDGTD